VESTTEESIALTHNCLPPSSRPFAPPRNSTPCTLPPSHPTTGPQVDQELFRERNIRPSFNLGAGIWGGIAYSALDTYLLRGQAPWTLRHRWGAGPACAGEHCQPLPCTMGAIGILASLQLMAMIEAAVHIPAT